MGNAMHANRGDIGLVTAPCSPAMNKNLPDTNKGCANSDGP